MVRIYIRHSSRLYENGKSNDLTHDSNITKEGINEAIKLVPKLVKKWGWPNLIVTSPYKRARETSFALLEGLEQYLNEFNSEIRPRGVNCTRNSADRPPGREQTPRESFSSKTGYINEKSPNLIEGLIMNIPTFKNVSIELRPSEESNEDIPEIRCDVQLSDYLGNQYGELLDVDQETKIHNPPHPETFYQMDSRVRRHNDVMEALDPSEEVVWFITHGLIQMRIVNAVGYKLSKRLPPLGCLILYENSVTKDLVCKIYVNGATKFLGQRF